MGQQAAEYLNTLTTRLESHVREKDKCSNRYNVAHSSGNYALARREETLLNIYLRSIRDTQVAINTFHAVSAMHENV
jgi:hypothetical protein